jgi:hypothetical protein
MVDFDINKTASSVLGIAGMGIGLGLLAHTASNISRMTDSMYERPVERPRQTQARKRAYKESSQSRQSYYNNRTPRSKVPSMYENYWW